MVCDQPTAEPVHRFSVPPEAAGERLDVFLSRLIADRSRVQLRRAIQAGQVLVDDRTTKAAYRLRGGEVVSVRLSRLPREGPEPEDIPLDVLYEDESLIVINKPPGMVVHPGKGHWSGTLTSALAFRFRELSTVGGAERPGIVHRLDRDTSGVMVVAKTDSVHMALAEQFEQRLVEKEYYAIVAGYPDRDRDWIEQPIGIHPYQREKMAIRNGHGTSREAATFYEVLERKSELALVRVQPRTGRTHQIRVHLAHIGCPVLCDRLYGGRSRLTRGELLGTDDEHVVLQRQALHARRLAVTHPISGERREFVAPLPEDMKTVLELAGFARR